MMQFYDVKSGHVFKSQPQAIFNDLNDISWNSSKCANCLKVTKRLTS